LTPTLVKILEAGLDLGLKFQPNGKLAFGIIGIHIGLLEVDGNLILVVKPRPSPPSKKYPYASIDVDIEGILPLCILVEGNDVTCDIPQIE